MGKQPLAAVWGEALSEANQSLPLRQFSFLIGKKTARRSLGEGGRLIFVRRGADAEEG